MKVGQLTTPFPLARPFLKLSGTFTGYQETYSKLCMLDRLLLRIRCNAFVTVQVHAGKQVFTYEGQDIQQLLKPYGNLIRMSVDGMAHGIIELVEA